MQVIVDEISAERAGQRILNHDALDRRNTRNDWVAYINAYAGRAANTQRNVREGQGFRENMIKVAALAIAAIEAHDNDHC